MTKVFERAPGRSPNWGIGSDGSVLDVATIDVEQAVESRSYEMVVDLRGAGGGMAWKRGDAGRPIQPKPADALRRIFEAQGQPVADKEAYANPDAAAAAKEVERARAAVDTGRKGHWRLIQTDKKAYGLDESTLFRFDPAPDATYMIALPSTCFRVAIQQGGVLGLAHTGFFQKDPDTGIRVEWRDGQFDTRTGVVTIGTNLENHAANPVWVKPPHLVVAGHRFSMDAAKDEDFTAVDPHATAMPVSGLELPGNHGGKKGLYFRYVVADSQVRGDVLAAVLPSGRDAGRLLAEVHWRPSKGDSSFSTAIALLVVPRQPA